MTTLYLFGSLGFCINYENYDCIDIETYNKESDERNEELKMNFL